MAWKQFNYGHVLSLLAPLGSIPRVTTIKQTVIRTRLLGTLISSVGNDD